MNGKRGPPAKVSRPVLKGYFPRKRLFRLLDHSRTSPAIWISGPPGSGKTTLVSSYIENRKIPCLWYQVDEGDSDIASFFYYLGIAGKRAAPRRKKQLPLLTPERLPGLSVFTNRFFEDLFGRLKAPSILVLDDCQKAPSDSLFFETVRDGLSRIPAGMNVILLSRSDPHPAFARKRAHGVLETLTWKDLRLTLEETEGVARMRWKSGRPDGRLVRDLHGFSDGWAAGLVLLMEDAGTDGIRGARPGGRLAAAEIFDYFAGEIFGKLDAETRDFLCKSAFLPKMTAGMAESVTGSRESARRLAYMARHNYFTQEHPGEEPVFEYHALFREFLLARAKNAYTDEELHRLLKDAAAALLGGGQVEAAVEVMRQADDVQAMVQVIVTHAPFLVGKGRFRTLLGWLEALPKQIVENEPWLLYWDGVCRMGFSPGESRVRFEEAFRRFDARQEAPGAFVSWSGAIDSILIEQKNYRLMDPWITHLPALLDKYGGIPSGELGDQITCTIFKALEWRRPRTADIESWAARVLAVVQNSDDARLKIESMISHISYSLGRGDCQVAEIHVAALREIQKRSGATPIMRLWTDWIEATLSIFLSMHERCVRVSSGALLFAEDTGVHVLDSVFVGYCALGSLHIGDSETANRFLRRMATTMSTTAPAIVGLYHLVFACQALHRRELGKAAYHSEESVRNADESGNVKPLPIVHLLAAHVHHDRQEDDEAAGHLERARRICSDIESPHLWLCALSDAYFHLNGNEEASAIARLREGLRTGREHGTFGTFLWLPHFLATICAKALEEGIEVDYVRELIRRNRLLPVPGRPLLEQWPWPVKVYTLGRFGLLREEKPIEFSRKVQQKPLKLLKALIALGGRDVPREQLTDILWPEADGDLAQQSFTASLHRLRQLLGEEKALELKEGRLTLSARHCWVDAWAFEQLAGEGLDPGRGRGGDAGREPSRLLEKALALYRGQFLAGEPEEPHLVSMRERLRGRFLRAVAELGRRREEAGRWEEAASCYRKGLDADDLAEELYRRLMACHIRQGQDAEALSVYRRCRTVLSGVLGVEPSPATVALSKSIGCVTA